MEDIEKLYYQGFDFGEIAEKVGISVQEVKERLSSLGIQGGHKQYKWSQDLADKVKQLYWDGLTFADISKEVGVNIGSVKSLVHRNRWQRNENYNMYHDIKRMLKEKVSIESIAQLYGWDVIVMTKWCKDKGLIKEPKPRTPRKPKEEKVFDPEGGFRVCYTCKKKFYRWYWDKYIYKRTVGKKTESFCSYNCMRAWEKEAESKAKKKDGRWQYI